MSLRNLLTVAAIIAFVFGLGFVLIPAQLSSLYNVALNPGGSFIGQLFGAALIGFAVLNWFARGVKDSQALQAILLANLIGDGVGFVLALIGQVTGVTGVNQLGWSTVAIYLLLTLGFAYFQFMKPSAS
jgi:ABC-type transport system involved in multi-copper enzyme maturation permease subunit